MLNASFPTHATVNDKSSNRGNSSKIVRQEGRRNSVKLCWHGRARQWSSGLTMNSAGRWISDSSNSALPPVLIPLVRRLVLWDGNNNNNNWFTVDWRNIPSDINRLQLFRWPLNLIPGLFSCTLDSSALSRQRTTKMKILHGSLIIIRFNYTHYLTLSAIELIWSFAR